MMSYQQYTKKYVGNLRCLGYHGDWDYYYDAKNEEVIKLASESNLSWENLTPQYFYGKQALEIKKVWDSYDDYEYEDEFDDVLRFVEE